MHTDSSVRRQALSEPTLRLCGMNCVTNYLMEFGADMLLPT
jgi:hypothetical protein